MSAGENLLREIFQATPVERLQVAIEKLERLKDTATPGDWRAGSDSYGNAEVRSWFDNDQNGNTRIAHAYAHDRADSYLIVILHRTIDAQLAILREALFQLEGSPSQAGFIGNEFNLFMQLADAILGGDS